MCYIMKMNPVRFKWIKPSHYQTQINDDRVKKILDTLMSHYKSLKTDAIKKGVK